MKWISFKEKNPELYEWFIGGYWDEEEDLFYTILMIRDDGTPDFPLDNRDHVKDTLVCPWKGDTYNTFDYKRMTHWFYVDQDEPNK